MAQPNRRNLACFITNFVYSISTSVLNKLMYRHDMIVAIAPLVLTESLHASSVCTVLSADIKWVPLVFD